MKKVLVMMLVFGLAFAAFAGSHVDFGGDATTSIEINTANCGSGAFSWWAEGFDSNGYKGARHEFDATGSFDVDATISVGPYGSLDTKVKADSCSPATFNLYGWQDFDVTNGWAPTTPYMRIGELAAYVEGSTSAHMDVELRGSMYYFLDVGPYTYPTTANPNWMLKGEGDYEVSHFVGMIDKNTMTYDARSYIELAGTGDGEFGFSSAYFAETHKSGTTKYPQSGTMYAQANGAGDYYQDAYGANYVKFNGFEYLGGGNPVLSGPFNTGFLGNPSVEAK